MSLGDPAKPVENVDWNGVSFIFLEPVETDELKVQTSLIQFFSFIFTTSLYHLNWLKLFNAAPTLEAIGVKQSAIFHQQTKVIGGETVALKQMFPRLQMEKEAFVKGLYRPLQARPDLLGPPVSFSAAIAQGAISVRL